MPQPPPPAELYTHTLADWLALPLPKPEGAALCGRITLLISDPQPAALVASRDQPDPQILFDDGDTACFLRGPAVLRAGLCIGDFVRVLPQAGPSHPDASSSPPSADAIRAGSRPCIAVADLQILDRPSGGTQFLSPDADWYRLQRDARTRIHRIKQRASLVSSVRQFFAQRDFVEIEAPLQVPSPGLELHLSAFATQPGGRYLITSPEYQCKRLLAGGLRRIYSLGKVFRAGEAGPHHNPEFTMLEWYRAYAGWQAIADDVAALCAHLVAQRPGGDGTPLLSRNGPSSNQQILDLSLPWPQLSVCEAMARYAGVTLRGDESLDELTAALSAAGHRPTPPGPTPLTWDERFFSVFLDHVEPQLAAPQPDTGHIRPVVLYDWPLPLCALARPRPDNPAVVERFEAYIAGLELCNGFGELCDPHEQRRRLEHDADQRARRGLPVYPQDERFLSALSAGMPPSAGVALGIDRLLMLLTGAQHIRDVLPFSTDEL